MIIRLSTKHIMLLSILSLLILTPFQVNLSQGQKQLKVINISKQKLISEFKQELENEIKLWYPLSIDKEYGGYFSDINYKWELRGPQAKMIVTQARHIWSNANASIFFKAKEPYLTNAKHGFEFLKNVMWDKKYGGFYNLVDREGKVIKDNGKIIKQAYGNAFAIYGLAAYYKAFGDTASLNLAVETFNWLEDHSYDPKFDGYYNFISEEGKPLTDGYRNNPSKDQNSSIHLLESYYELYSVWPDPKLKERLNSLLEIIRDKVIGTKGYMTLFFNKDWSPISYRDSSEEERERNYEFDHISFGHAVETAYLLLEASHILGIMDDSKTLKVAKQLDDFALANGWDYKNGGIYDRGYIFKGDNKVKIIKDTKEWWCQIEALNSFLMMSKLYPDDKENYYQKFLEEWKHINKYTIDKKYGGWFWDSIDTNPSAEHQPKATIWKANYHTTRGLINCIERLKD